jgi:hypothetical protein
MPRNYNNQKKIDLDFSWLNNTAQNTSKYIEISSSNISNIARQAKFSFPLSYRLVRLNSDEDHFELALLSDSTKELVYYIQCVVIPDVYLNAKPVTQVLLWRTTVVSHQNVTTGFARDVFRHYLLESYNIIASDGCQTREGRDFWVRQLGYAIEFGEYVYKFNRVTCDLKKITDHATIRDNSCDLWGDSEEYENILAIISKELLITQSA